MAKVYEVAEGLEVPGIRFHGEVYAVDPVASELIKAQAFMGKKKDLNIEDLLKAIVMIVPEFPVDKMRKSEISPVMDAITLCLKDEAKNV